MTLSMRSISSSFHNRSTMNSMHNTNCSASQRKGDPSRQDSDPPDNRDQELWDKADRFADQMLNGFDLDDWQDATIFDDDGTNDLLEAAVMNQQEDPDISVLDGDLIDFLENGSVELSSLWQTALSPEVLDHQYALPPSPVSESLSGSPGLVKSADRRDITHSISPNDIYDMSGASSAAGGDVAMSDDDETEGVSSMSSASASASTSTSSRSVDNVIAKAYEQARSLLEKREPSQRMDSAPSRSATPTTSATSVTPTTSATPTRPARRSRPAKPRAGRTKLKAGPVPKLKKWSSLNPDEQLQSMTELTNIISSQLEVRERYDAIQIIAPNCTISHTDGPHDFVINEDMRKGINNSRFTRLQKFVRQHASGCGVKKPTSQDSPERSKENFIWLQARPNDAAHHTGRGTSGGGRRTKKSSSSSSKSPELHPALEVVVVSSNVNDEDDDVNILD